MKLLKRAAVVWGVCILAGVAIGIGAHAYEREQMGWVAHTFQVQAQICMVQMDMCDIETGARGYIILPKSELLRDYRKGMAAYPGDLDELQELTNDNPVQQANIQTLRAQIKRKVDFMVRVVSARETGGMEAVNKLSVGTPGLHYMDAIRATIGRMQAEESRLLQAREARA